MSAWPRALAAKGYPYQFVFARNAVHCDRGVKAQTLPMALEYDRVGLNHRETSPPTGPESVQQNPQEPVAAVEAQATRPVLLENCKLVAKREDLRL